MLQANEQVLLVVVFIVLAGIIAYAIGSDYENTISNISNISNQNSLKANERIEVIDVQKNGNELFIILVNRSEIPRSCMDENGGADIEANCPETIVTFTHFWDVDGHDVKCYEPNIITPFSETNTLVIMPGDKNTIVCAPNGDLDIVLFTEYYNLIKIDNPEVSPDTPSTVPYLRPTSNVCEPSLTTNEVGKTYADGLLVRQGCDNGLHVIVQTFNDAGDFKIKITFTNVFENPISTFYGNIYGAGRGSNCAVYDTISISDPIAIGETSIIEINCPTETQTENASKISIVIQQLHPRATAAGSPVTLLPAPGTSNPSTPESEPTPDPEPTPEPAPEPETQEPETPLTPPTLVAGTITDTSIVLSWTAIDDATSYELFRDGNSVRITSALTYTSTGLAPETAYTYTIRSIGDSSMSSELSTPLTVFTIAEPVTPLTPPTLVAGTITDTSIVLSWTAISDATSYELFRDGVLIWDADSSTRRDRGLAPETAYTYTITSTDGTNTSELSTPLTVSTTPAPQPEPVGVVPDKPLNLISSSTHNSITLNWDDPSDDSITGYKITSRTSDQRSLSTLVSNTGSSNPFYVVENLIPDTTYIFKVIAINDVGESTPSSFTRVSTEPEPQQPVLPHPAILSVGEITDTSIELFWTAQDGAIEYDLFRDGASLVDTAGLTFIDTGLTPDTSYIYKIRSTDGTTETVYLTSLTVSTTPTPQPTPEPTPEPETPVDDTSQPATTLIPGEITDTSITFSWTAQSAISLYEVFRDGVSIGTSTSPTFTDTGLSPETAYTYYVEFLIDTHVPPSNPLTMTTIATPQPEPIVTEDGILLREGRNVAHGLLIEIFDDDGTLKGKLTHTNQQLEDIIHTTVLFPSNGSDVGIRDNLIHVAPGDTNIVEFASSSRYPLDLVDMLKVYYVHGYNPHIRYTIEVPLFNVN